MNDFGGSWRRASGFGGSQVSVINLGAGGGGTPTTWNSGDQVGMNITGSGLIATNNTGSAGGVRTLASVSGSSKVYWEIVVGSDDGQMSVGIANASWNLTTTLRGTTSGAGWRDDANIFLNFSNIASTPSYTGSDVLSLAVDYANKTIWGRVNGGNWNSSATANPATNTEGGDFSTITGAIYPAFWAPSFGASVTAVFSSSSWTYAAPSGFIQVT